MRLTRFAMLLGFGVLLTLGLFKTRGEAQPGSFSEVVKGVWFREGDLSLGHCNNTVIEMKDGLVVIPMPGEVWVSRSWD